MTKDNKNLIVGLDIGTSKVLIAVAEIGEDGQHKIIGIGEGESTGVKKGVVVNIDETIEAIQKALEQAESSSNCKIKNVYVGICGNHIQSFNSSGMVAIKEKEVNAADVAKVIETAKVINIPHDQQLLHVIPQEFIIDGVDDIKEPIGMNGKRLEVRVHIATGAISAVQNVVKCVQKQGLDVSDIIFLPIAAAEAVLTADEKELGVVFIDIGGGTTDVAIFNEGSVRHTAVIPIAGDQITSDIAMALRTPKAQAEEIKIKHGVALHTLVNNRETISVPGIANHLPRSVLRQQLASVIEPRIEEILLMVQQVMFDSGHHDVLSRGVVIAGGSSALPGIVELAESIFMKPVRIAYPEVEGIYKEELRNPKYASVLGLLLEAKKQHNRHIFMSKKTTTGKYVVQRAKEWFLGNF
jgi:cell division protein FtsA